MTFITLARGEEETLTLPENQLDTHQLILLDKEAAYYKAYSKYNSEEFWTSNSM